MLDSEHHHISVFPFRCPAGACFSGVIHANGRHRPRKHTALRMRCCWDALHIGMCCCQDVLYIGMHCRRDVLYIGMCCRQDVLHVLTEAESSGEEREAWLLGKASLSR